MSNTPPLDDASCFLIMSGFCVIGLMGLFLLIMGPLTIPLEMIRDFMWFCRRIRWNLYLLGRWLRSSSRKPRLDCQCRPQRNPYFIGGDDDPDRPELRAEPPAPQDGSVP